MTTLMMMRCVCVHMCVCRGGVMIALVLDLSGLQLELRMGILVMASQ